MTEIDVFDGTLHVRTSWLRGSVREDLAIPIDKVVSVEIDSQIAKELWKGLRFGVDIPWVRTAGLFWMPGRRELWDTRGTRPAVVITLRDHGYARIVATVDDPHAVVRAIEASV